MINAIWSIFFFLILLGILVTIHEFGHYWMARKFGVKVYRFSIGFGPVIFTRTWKNGTEFAISILPFGGYVKMKGEADDPLQGHEKDYQAREAQRQSNQLDDQAESASMADAGKDERLSETESASKADNEEQHSHIIAETDFAELRIGYAELDDEGRAVDADRVRAHHGDNERADGSDSLMAKAWWQRMLILVAGPMSNIVLAFVVFIACNMLGIDELRPVLAETTPDSPAAQAAFQPFDEFKKIDGVEVRSWGDVMTELSGHASEKVQVTVSGNLGTEPERDVILDLSHYNFSIDSKTGPMLQLGFMPYVGEPLLELQNVVPDGIAYEHGVRAGDIIVAIDGQVATSWSFVQDSIRAADQDNPRPLSFVFMRKLAGGNGTASNGTAGNNVESAGAGAVGQLQAWVNFQGHMFSAPEFVSWLKHDYAQASLTKQLSDINAADYGFYEVSMTPEYKDNPQTGVRMAIIGIVTTVDSRPLVMTHRYGLVDSIALGAQQTARMSMLILTTVKKLLLGELSTRAISGPVTMAQVAGEAASLGLAYFLMLLAVISVNLGVVNLLPIPILDGGQILFVLYEGITKRRPSDSVRTVLSIVGLAVVLGLAALAIFNDLLFVGGL